MAGCKYRIHGPFDAVVIHSRQYKNSNIHLVIVFLFQVGKKALRQTTADKRKIIEEKRKEREVKDQLMREYARKRNVAAVRRLTQEELLEEAKHTEEMNLRSLGK